MNERFKFRAWLPELKKMVYPTVIRFVSKGIAIEYEDDGQRCADGPGWFELMQCTGLRDRNGTLIFEGDILDGSWATPEDPMRFTVKWYDIHACFNLVWANTGAFEIVGNIHDNPELLRDNPGLLEGE